ncbi:MAG: winged helix-turn-helix domain-containing protein [Candidatus Dormibacteraceae bacterium]
MASSRSERALLGEVARQCRWPLLEVADEARAEAVLARATPVAALVFGVAGDDAGADRQTSRLKALRPGLPVLVVARARRRRPLVATLKVGADDVVRLPITAAELAARLRATLRRLRQEETPPSAADDRPISLGGLAIDVGRRRARRGERPLALTDTEFDLLATLAGSAGCTFSRERLLNRLCRFEYEIDSRTIDVHVRNLRRKVELDPAQPVLIRAVPGVGYCVAVPSNGGTA